MCALIGTLQPPTRLRSALNSSTAVKKGSRNNRDKQRAPFVDLSPGDLLHDDGWSGDAAKFGRSKWWLAHTRPQQEKAFAGELFKRTIAYYVPSITRKSLLGGRTRMTQLPLFPGYVFVCGTDEDRLIALKTNRAITIVEVVDGDCLRRQLKSFATLIAAKAPLVRESRLLPGERVRIKTGPFRDAEGIILRRNGKTELLVAIDFLGQGASLEIEDCGTEPV
jgi:transcription antitermination factor NusG